MSQLDAVYGDKEARTFATNHGLQILQAPREQRDADEQRDARPFSPSAPPRAGAAAPSAATGRARSAATKANNAAHYAASGVQGTGERAPGGDRRNCKPILGEKIRYHRDKATPRLLPAPAVPRMDMDLAPGPRAATLALRHDELAPGESLKVSREALAHDFNLPPDTFEGPPDKVADVMLGFGAGQSGAGGAVEAVADEDGILPSGDDGALASADERALDVADLDAPGETSCTPSLP